MNTVLSFISSFHFKSTISGLYFISFTLTAAPPKNKKDSSNTKILESSRCRKLYWHPGLEEDTPLALVINFVGSSPNFLKWFVFFLVILERNK